MQWNPSKRTPLTDTSPRVYILPSGKRTSLINHLDPSGVHFWGSTDYIIITCVYTKAQSFARSVKKSSNTFLLPLDQDWKTLIDIESLLSQRNIHVHMKKIRKSTCTCIIIMHTCFLDRGKPSRTQPCIMRQSEA